MFIAPCYHLGYNSCEDASSWRAAILHLGVKLVAAATPSGRPAVAEALSDHDFVAA
jgi:hypothetical protein